MKISFKPIKIISFLSASLIFSACSSDLNIDKDTDIEISENIISSPTISKSVEKSLMLPNIKRIIQKGYLTVAMIPDDTAVFCHTVEGGNFEGLDVTLAQNIADILGVKLNVYVTKKYSDIPALLINNEADLAIAMYSINPHRAASISLSDPYIISNLCLTVNNKELAKHNIEKNPMDYIKNHKVKIAVLEGSIHAVTVKQSFPKSEIVEIPTQEGLVDAIINDKVFAIFEGQIECLDDYIRRPETTIFTKSFVFTDASDKFCVAIPPDNIDMLNFINAFIDSNKILVINDIEQACKKLYNY